MLETTVIPGITLKPKKIPATRAIPSPTKRSLLAAKIPWGLTKEGGAAMRVLAMAYPSSRLAEDEEVVEDNP